ncbi:MAG: protein kinase domain-containing protein [Thermoguttaceae bacterium]
MMTPEMEIRGAADPQRTTDFSSQDAAGPTAKEPERTIADPSVAVPPVPESAATESRFVMGQLHAEGGIGRVWLARDRQLDREVALKTLRPEFLGNHRLRSRFLQEAQITGQLEHPGIVPVYELVADPQSGEPFYAMRFVRGRTLARAAREYHARRQAGTAEPLGLVALLSALVTVCNTVAYAHSRRVIHRDLKGENVLLGDFGEVIVLDWGVAKLLGAAEEGNPSAENWRVTAPADQTMQGDVVGTPAYMAPEQAEGRLSDIDSRTDVYGLGAILYEILTGQPPFTGSSTVEVLAMVSRASPVPPRAIWSDAPPTLETVCLKALSKIPSERFATASALGQEIHTWQEVQRQQAIEELRRSRERFELAVRGSQDGLWDWDLESNEVFYSARWKSILGYEDHEIAHQLDEWEKRLHPEERERVMAANFAHITGTTSHYEYEYRLRHKDGSYRWILARGVALRDAGGKAYRMAGSHVDITARKEMERAMQEQQQRYLSILEAVPSGVLVADADGYVRDCNRLAPQLLGIARENLVERPVAEVLGHGVVGDGCRLAEAALLAQADADSAHAGCGLVAQFRGEDGATRQVRLVCRRLGAAGEIGERGLAIFVQPVETF